MICLSCFFGPISHLIYVECYILQFEDARDAEDAIRYRDGYKFDGLRLRVSTHSHSTLWVMTYDTGLANAFVNFYL
jgi:hypothetical protein